MSNISPFIASLRAAHRAPKRASVRLKLMSLLGVALFAAPFATADLSPAKASPIACYALEQNCLAHAAKTRKFMGALRSDASGSVRKDSLDSFCYDSSAQARGTGVWPAHDAAPAIACAN